MSHRFAPGSLSSASPHETEKIVRLARYFESKPMLGQPFSGFHEQLRELSVTRRDRWR